MGDFDCVGMFVVVVCLFHISNTIEITHKVNGSDPLSRLNGSSAKLGDEADIVALMTPRLIDY